MAVTANKTWTLNASKKGFDQLEFSEKTIPDLSDNDVLGKYSVSALKEDVVPGSDGAGTVIDVGRSVTRFKTGDKVLTVFAQVDDAPTATDLMNLSLGTSQDGVFRQYGVFSEERLVAMPSSLDFQQDSTLSCAGLTAWNALFGFGAYGIKPGDTVLTQGTGGVSMFAIQFAKSAGATVIATTSSETKAEYLRNMALAPDHIIDYATEPDWGEKAKALSRNGHGVDHIVEIEGPGTMSQSFKAIKLGGVISVVGVRGGNSDTDPSLANIIVGGCILRGVLVGNRQLLEEMIRAVDANEIKPVLDAKVWELEQLKEAYQYLAGTKHTRKITVKIAE